MHEMPTVKASCLFLVRLIYSKFLQQVPVIYLLISDWNIDVTLALFIKATRDSCCHVTNDLYVCHDLNTLVCYYIVYHTCTFITNCRTCILLFLTYQNRFVVLITGMGSSRTVLTLEDSSKTKNCGLGLGLGLEDCWPWAWP